MLKGYRTLIANILLGLVAVASLPEFQAVIPADYLPWIMLAAALGNIWLRKITTTPMGRKQ